MQYQLSPRQKQAFHLDGYLIRRGFFSPFREKNLSCIQPIKKVADSQLLQSEVKKLEGADFLSKEKEITLHVK